MESVYGNMVPNTVPLLRRPKKQNSKPERMSIRSTNSTTRSNLESSNSHPSTTIPLSPNNTTVRGTLDKSNDGTDVTTQEISRINQMESIILPKPPTNSPTKSPPPQNLHSLEPKGPAPFLPTNRKVFNNQASLYAQLFSSPPSSSGDHFTLNDFQQLARTKSSTPASISTVIKSTQNYKKLTSWLEAFPPSQMNLNTLKLEVDVEIPQIRIPKHQFLLELHAYIHDKLGVSSVVSLEESELEQISLTGYLPQGDLVLQGPISGYFCGEKRWTSPFAPKKPMQSPSDASLLKCMETDCKELNLKAQFLHHLPDISLLTKKLTVLNLSFNMLKILPSSIFAATNLKELYLRNNPLLLIPSEIDNLVCLRTLSVSFCLLEDLPHSFYSLYNLRELDISYNRIKRISHKIGNLRELTFLNLEGNELPGLPIELTRLQWLKHLKVTNNFMHSFIWNEYLNTRPDHLQDICLKTLLHELYEDDMDRVPRKLYVLFNQRSNYCANCELVFFGSGKEMIPSVTPDHSTFSYPVIHNVCAERCIPFLKDKFNQN